MSSRGPHNQGDRLRGLFLLALVLFNPPLLGLFDGVVAGVPLLYAYLFCAWALVIVLIGLAMRAPRRGPPPAGEG